MVKKTWLVTVVFLFHMKKNSKFVYVRLSEKKKKIKPLIEIT